MALLGNAGGNMGATMGPQRPAGQGMKPFPANKDDVMKFIVDLSRAMYNEQQQAEIVNILKQGANNIGQTIGQLAGSMVMTAIQRRMQEQGVKPHIKLAVMGLKFAIEALSEVADAVGIQVTQEDLQEAASVGGAIAENAGKQQGQPMPREQAMSQMQGMGIR